MKIFKNSTVKIISIVLLVVGGGIFFMSLPKLFSKILTKIIDSIPTEPMYDADGKMIHQDDRHTLYSFGNRRQFSIEKCGGGTEISVYLLDRDKGKEIDEIKNFTLSSIPYIYAFGRNGYTKLNYETGETIQSENITDFSVEDQKILKNIESYNYLNELNEKRHKRKRNS